MNWKERKKEHGVYFQVKDVNIPERWEPTPGQPVTRYFKDKDLILSLDCTGVYLMGQVRTVFNEGTRYQHETTDILKVAFWSDEEDRWKSFN